MKLSVCLPSFNEPNISAFVKEIEREVKPYEIIVGHDFMGKGKGWALKQAVRQAQGDRIIFIDGDGDIKAKEIHKILKYLDKYDIVVGRKNLPGRWDRKILTFASRLWIRLLFGIQVDTQTGIKGFNYKPKWKTDSWAFDIEILYLAKRKGKTMKEVSVQAVVSDRKSFSDIWTTLMDTIRIRSKYV
jgi:glycosyltransferase involved in cell wall biosynthesis